MKITASTDLGCRHEENQDFYRAGRLCDDTYWIVLCDGMGGVAQGGKASKMAGEFLQKQIQQNVPDLISLESVKNFMLEAANKCNKEIFALNKESNNTITMGTTLVMAIARNNQIQIVHAGDSRAYLIQKGIMKQITTDHSIVQELLDSGKITAEQAINHPNKNIITSALGVDCDTRIDYDEHRFSKGDILLLCTDGLSNMVTDTKIIEIIKENDFYRTAEKLVKKAVEAGGYDNITAVVLEA